MLFEALKRIYHHPNDSGILGGVEKLLRHAKKLHISGVTKKWMQKLLQSEQAYRLHKPARRRVTKNHTYVAEIDAQWQADLADM